MVNRNLAAIFELLLALGALLGADLLALALALLVALPRLEGLDDGRVLPAALARSSWGRWAALRWAGLRSLDPQP